MLLCPTCRKHFFVFKVKILFSRAMYNIVNCRVVVHRFLHNNLSSQFDCCKWILLFGPSLSGNQPLSNNLIKESIVTLTQSSRWTEDRTRICSIKNLWTIRRFMSADALILTFDLKPYRWIPMENCKTCRFI